MRLRVEGESEREGFDVVVAWLLVTIVIFSFLVWGFPKMI